jgi:hypothetical protein
MISSSNLSDFEKYADVNGISIRTIHRYPHGYHVEMSYKNFFFEVRRMPTLVEALDNCLKKVLEHFHVKNINVQKDLIVQDAPQVSTGSTNSGASDFWSKHTGKMVEIPISSAVPNEPPTEPKSNPFYPRPGHTIHFQSKTGDGYLHSLCNAVHGEGQNYSIQANEVTCIRCLRMMRKS